MTRPQPSNKPKTEEEMDPRTAAYWEKVQKKMHNRHGRGHSRLGAEA